MKTLPIILIIIFGSVIRFWNLEKLTTFSGDQGYDFLIVKHILESDLTLLGPKIGPYNEIGNLYLGPAYYYLLAPALFLFNLDPIGGAVLSVVLATLAIAAIYKFCREFLSRQIGIIAAFLYSTNSFLINQSRASSNPHLLPFFSIIFFYTLFKSKKSNAKIWPLVAGFSLGIMFQLHYLSASQIPLVLMTGKKYKNLLLISASFLAALSPQILFELRNKFFITNLFIKQMQYGRNIAAAGDFLIRLQILALALAAFGLIFYLYQNPLKRTIVLGLSASIVLAIMAITFYSGSLQPHYFAYVYSQLAIILAILFWSIYRFFENHLSKFSAILVFFLVAAVNINGLNLESDHGYTMPQGWSLTGIKKASKIIAQDANPTKKFNIAATLDGDTRARPYRYLVEVYGKTPQDVERYPDSQVLYLIARDEPGAIKDYTVWEVASLKPFEITAIWDIQNGINLYKLEKSI